MPLKPAAKAVVQEVTALVHADRKREAALRFADHCEINLKCDGEDPKKYLPVLQHLLHFLLNNHAPFEAAQLLWTKNQFDPRPQFTQDVWKLFDETSRGLIMGGGSCSKSFSVGARLFLEWVRDPEWTTVRVAGPSADHLESNLFSGLVRLHETASLPMPGSIESLFIGSSRRNQLGSIKGIVVPLGKSKKAGRIQGAKRERRLKAHPIFGERSRLLCFFDEFENIPEGIWADIDNLLSNISADPGNFKILGAYNPRDLNHEVAKRAEPVKGWGAFDIEADYRWRSKRGWDVLRLDGEKCENVVQGREIFPGLQTQEGLDAIAENAGGKETPGYMTMGRGAYPKMGMITSIIPEGMFNNCLGTPIWYNEPESIASCDFALDGGAAAIFTNAKWGLVSGAKFAPSLGYPEGRTLMFKGAGGQVTPRYMVFVTRQTPLPKGDTIVMSAANTERCKKAGVKPRYFACDRTGVGRGTADLMKHGFGSEIHSVNYSEGASESKLMQEDTKTCAEEYDRMTAELWYALRAYMEHGYLLLDPSVDWAELKQQVVTRLAILGSVKSKVESKKEYMKRGFKSPDEADSLTLVVHAARKGSGIVLSRLGENVSDDGEDWYDSHYGGVRIDPSNRNDSLELV